MLICLTDAETEEPVWVNSLSISAMHGRKREDETLYTCLLVDGSPYVVTESPIAIDNIINNMIHVIINAVYMRFK